MSCVQSSQHWRQRQNKERHVCVPECISRPDVQGVAPHARHRTTSNVPPHGKACGTLHIFVSIAVTSSVKFEIQVVAEHNMRMSSLIAETNRRQNKSIPQLQEWQKDKPSWSQLGPLAFKRVFAVVMKESLCLHLRALVPSYELTIRPKIIPLLHLTFWTIDLRSRNVKFQHGNCPGIILGCCNSYRRLERFPYRNLWRLGSLGESISAL